MKKLLAFVSIIAVLCCFSCKREDNRTGKSDVTQNKPEQSEENNAAQAASGQPEESDATQNESEQTEESDTAQSEPEQTEESDTAQNKVEQTKQKQENFILKPWPAPVNAAPEYLLEKGDSEVLEAVSKTEFNEDIVFEWNGQKITVERPIFTGIRIDKIHSYKDFYTFNEDGWVPIDLSGIGDYLVINKNGKIIFDGYEEPIKHTRNKYMLMNTADYPIVGEGVKVIMTGEPGNYKDKLYTMDDKPLTDYYDAIGCFYNGLALVTKDRKVGIIDEKGNELLAPVISYDKIKYHKDKRFYVHIMDQDAFILPIGGELAVINIKREKLHP